MNVYIISNTIAKIFNIKAQVAETIIVIELLQI